MLVDTEVFGNCEGCFEASKAWSHRGLVQQASATANISRPEGQKQPISGGDIQV